MSIILKKIFTQLNIVAQCKRQSLSLWRCPQFLFVIMGIVIMISAVITYILATRYIVDPQTVFFIIGFLTIILFIITFSITRTLEGLAEANRMKSEFISIASHQLRSPITNLKWAINFLTSERLEKIEERQVYYQALKENTSRMEELVSDLLTVSRIEQGSISFKNIEFSLKYLVEGIISRFKLFVEGSNIKIKFEAKDSLSRAFGDPTQIKIVVENFIENAIRYTKKQGMVNIKIKENLRGLIFEIVDTGLGIPKKDQKYIFQKFFQAKNVLKHKTQGLGLGLYICKSIIEKSRGKIGFKSQEGIGSTFWFTLPIK